MVNWHGYVKQNYTQSNLIHLQRDRDPDAERERRSRGLRLRGLRERDLKGNKQQFD